MRSTLIGMVVGLTALISLTSCNGTDPSNESRLEMQTEMSASTITSTGEKSGEVDGFRIIDSIRIHRTRILISRIKLHTVKETDDDVNDDDGKNEGRDVKVGPAVIDFTSGKVSTVFSTPIPVGSYKKIKLEMHKFSSSEAVTYTGDNTFGPFAAPERITLIVDGTLYVNGVAENFTWTDDQTSNLWIKFDPFIQITESSTTGIVLNFNPVVAFRSGGKLLDPKKSDIDNKNLLRAQIWSALFLRRK